MARVALVDGSAAAKYRSKLPAETRVVHACAWEVPTHPLFADDEEERDSEPGHDDEVDGAPLDDVDKEDAEDDDDEVADEAEAARKVELGSGG